MKSPIASIEMENGVTIVVELCPDAAPNTVNSFIYLANLGCFDDYAISRIVPGYVVDISYTAFGRDECKYLIENETQTLDRSRLIRMDPGVIGMGGYPQGIAGGEFFFPLEYSEKIDGKYPGFGYVRQGWDEITRWATVELRSVPLPNIPQMTVNEPVEPIVIRRVRVDTGGVEYPEPVRIEGAAMPYGW